MGSTTIRVLFHCPNHLWKMAILFCSILDKEALHASFPHEITSIVVSAGRSINTFNFHSESSYNIYKCGLSPLSNTRKSQCALVYLQRFQMHSTPLVSILPYEAYHLPEISGGTTAILKLTWAMVLIEIIIVRDLAICLCDKHVNTGLYM